MVSLNRRQPDQLGGRAAAHFEVIMSDYGDGCAEFYDDLYGPPNSNAVRALGRLVAGGSALELGIGTGRTALALRNYCSYLVGIESSSAMRDRFAIKRGAVEIRVIAGDFSCVRLAERFDLIFVLVNTLFLLETRALQSRCLSNVREMLSESGVFVVEAYDPSPGVIDGADDEQLMSYKHEVRTAYGIRQYEARLLYQSVNRLDSLAHAAGLELGTRWATWLGAPYTPNASTHISVYCRSGAPLNKRLEQTRHERLLC
jgi:SAM-dependent methyltransferase